MHLRSAMEELLTRKQAAAKLTFSVSEVDRLCERGELLKRPHGIRAVRIPRASVDAYLERRRNQAAHAAASHDSHDNDRPWVDPADPLRAQREARGIARDQRHRTRAQEPARG
jgi:excisionase family DNA binding protein